MLASALVAALGLLTVSALPQNGGVRPRGDQRRISYQKNGQNWNIYAKSANGDELSASPLEYYSGDRIDIWWLDLSGAPTPITLNNLRYCLDAGLSPTSGTRTKVWQCYDGAPQQTWQVINGNRIKLANKNLCLDLIDGNGPGTQLWECYDWNTNQQWNIRKLTPMHHG